MRTNFIKARGFPLYIVLFLLLQGQKVKSVRTTKILQVFQIKQVTVIVYLQFAQVLQEQEDQINSVYCGVWPVGMVKGQVRVCLLSEEVRATPCILGSGGVIDSTVDARLAHRYVQQKPEVTLILLSCSSKNFYFLTTQQQKDI